MALCVKGEETELFQNSLSNDTFSLQNFHPKFEK
jgi:hypothetical protein